MPLKPNHLNNSLLFVLFNFNTLFEKFLNKSLILKGYKFDNVSGQSMEKKPLFSGTEDKHKLGNISQ